MSWLTRNNYDDDTVPVYTTRKTAAGETFTYSTDARVTILLTLLLPALALIWAIIGIVYGFVVAVSAIIDVVQALVGLV